MEGRLARTDVTGPLLERFTRYVRVDTTSDPFNTQVKPSTQIQFDLAKILVDELKSIGVTNVELDEHCFVLAKIPASPGCESAPALMLSAHIDTSNASPGKNVNPQIHERYDGKPIALKDGIVIDPASTPQLKACVGDTLVTSDGTTLLGADDKAGLANIMTAVDEILNKHPIPHGRIELLFGSDEEVGTGMDFVPIEKMESKVGYTVDGHLIGEMECECFTAMNVTVTLTGISVHTGYARSKMANAVRMVSTLVGMLPGHETPETTDGYQGFFMVKTIEATTEVAKVGMIVRDFSREAIAERKARLEDMARAVERIYPGGKVEIASKILYENMRDKLAEDPRVTELMKTAAKNSGFEASFGPIRGGTDGSRLTQMGLLTPNIFSGSYNHHGRQEFAVLSHMVAAVDMLVELVKLWASEIIPA